MKSPLSYKMPIRKIQRRTKPDKVISKKMIGKDQVILKPNIPDIFKDIS